MKSKKGDKIVEFLIESIISIYGVPSKLFMDNDYQDLIFTR